MKLQYKGTFDATSIDTELKLIDSARITATSYLSGVLLVTYTGNPELWVLRKIQETIDNHDGTPNTAQLLKNITRKAMVDLEIGAETSRQIGWIVKDFNDDLEAIRSAYVAETSQELLDLSYSAWRITYDGLAAAIQADIIMFTSFFSDPAGNTFTEPTTPDNAYKVWFNLSIRDFLEYVTDRLQMKAF